MQLDLGRLGELLDGLAGECDEHGVSIKPVFEVRRVIGGIEAGTHANVVASWQLSFGTARGAFDFSGETVADAVAAAFASQCSWR